MIDVLKRNNVTIMGNGEQVLIFAHGFGCDQTSWKYIQDAFLPDYKMILFDYVGAGKSDLKLYDTVKYNSLKGYVRDVIEICEALNLKDIIFIGHSVSCMIGALAAIEKPDIFKQLIFISPSPCYLVKENYPGPFDQETIDTLFEVMEEDYIAWSKSFAPQVMDKENNAALGKELAESFCTVDACIAKQFARVTFLSDNRSDLPLIPVESLTIQSRHDTIAPLAVGQYMKEHTPKNSLTVIDTYGHCPHMSAPGETTKAMLDFIH